LAKTGEGRILDFGSQSRSLDEPGGDVWRKTLSQIPTLFGRLVYLASLWDPDRGRYEHPALTPLLGTQDADRTLCHHHHQIFTQWISSSLAEQKADLDAYVRGGGDRSRLLQQYRNLVPDKARDVERQLYLTDLETLMALLRYGNVGGSGTPGA
jgi:hypothetical protein